MYCFNCGVKVADDDVFCYACGTLLIEDDTNTASDAEVEAKSETAPVFEYISTTEPTPNPAFEPITESSPVSEAPAAGVSSLSQNAASFEADTSGIDIMTSAASGSNRRPDSTAVMPSLAGYAHTYSAPANTPAPSTKTSDHKSNAAVIALCVCAVIIVVLVGAIFWIVTSSSTGTTTQSSTPQTSTSASNSTTDSNSSDQVLSEDDEYVLPDSDSRYYTRSELEALSSWDLKVAHNEIYARHGRGFNDTNLAAHFAACSWYTQLYTPEEYDALPSMLNNYEQQNSDLMAQIRRERGEY